ncbi:MAG: alpha-E domain-containing protein, partial [Rhodopirellula sp. JB044]|uniref:alpha-E domain-containing protein n=1 Tax=Rhodopirellula sp. JB044 TaxID=3342844 RepID=UPI00370BFF86
HRCVASAGWSLGEIDQASSNQSSSLSSGKVDALKHRLAHTQVEEVLAGGMHEFVDHLQRELNDIGNTLAEDYFQAPVSA